MEDDEEWSPRRLEWAVEGHPHLATRAQEIPQRLPQPHLPGLLTQTVQVTAKEIEPLSISYAHVCLDHLSCPPRQMLFLNVMPSPDLCTR